MTISSRASSLTTTGRNPGGVVIAFVGPEATGKSTLVNETATWLGQALRPFGSAQGRLRSGQAFEVTTAHLGKPPSTWLTFLPNLTLPLLRRVTPQHRTSRVAKDEQKAGHASLLYALRSVMVAWDRRALAARLRRKAANGGIVVCDRYPSATVGAMDSARLEASKEKGILGYLARLENHIYRQIPPPDVVIRLTVPIEVAIERNRERQKKGKEGDAYVVRRHTSGTVPVFPTARTIELNSDQTQSQTIQRVREIVRSVL